MALQKFLLFVLQTGSRCSFEEHRVLVAISPKPCLAYNWIAATALGDSSVRNSCLTLGTFVVIT